MSLSADDLPRIRAENEKFPKNATGHVVSPRYTPVGSSYLSEWRLWLKEHPKAEWPLWLKHDIAQMKGRR